MPRAKKPKKPVENPRLPRRYDPLELLGNFRRTHRLPTFLGDWTIETVLAARDAQMRGQFRQAVRLADKMKTDAAIYSAELNRIAPHCGLPREIVSVDPLKQASAVNIVTEAMATFAVNTSSALPPGVIADDFDRVAMHAVGVDQIYWEARADGSRLDAFVQPFPLDCVEWSAHDQMLIATTTDGRIPIVHGDGRWLVTAKHEDRPWRWGALVPLAGIISSRPFAIRDRSSNSQSHGEDHWIGTLPDQIPILGDDGELSADALAMLDQMEKLYEFRRVMIKPYGSELKREEAMGQNYQIFGAIIESDNKDAQRILLGQDGSMTNAGGNYVKAWYLFGVRNDLVESDLATVGSAYSTGLLRPWSLVNFGRWDRLQYRWLIPDADEDARVESLSKRRAAFWAELELAKRNGAVVDQAFVDARAHEYRIEAPKMRVADPAAVEAAAAREAQAEREASEGPASLHIARRPLQAAGR